MSRRPELRLSAEERDFEVEMRLSSASPELVAGLARFGREARADGASVTMRVADEAQLPEMTRWLASHGVGLYHLAARRRSLEDLFLEVMGDGAVR